MPQLFIFKIVLAVPGPLHFLVNFRISLSLSAKNPAGILTALNLQITLGSTAILTVLSFNP